MGKVRIAQTLARAGLVLAPTTVARLIKRKGNQPPSPSSPRTKGKRASRVVTATEPHRLYHIDFTLVPSLGGFWVPWLPQALLPLWPFCFWVGVVLDHFSRAIVAHKVFAKQPSEDDVCALLESAIQNAGRVPRYIVSDKGAQFGERYRSWCAARGITPRFGAIGKKGSIAVIERFFRTLKTEGLRPILVPLRLPAFATEVAIFASWYNTHRSHQGLAGLTPAEQMRPARKTRRFNPRGDPTCRNIRGIELRIRQLEGRSHLPIVELRRAA
jgi:transposase InsO family protein